MNPRALDHKACADCASRPHCLLGRQEKALRAAWEPHIRERRVQRGEVLQRQGAEQAFVQIVKVGTVLLQRSAGDGVHRPIGLAGCGQTLGTPGLLEQPADLSCVAVLPGRVCEIDVATLARSELLAGNALLDLAREQLRAYALLADWARILRVRGATGQLAGALLLLADAQRSTRVRLPSHAVLASLLATTRETVARSITQLTRLNGLVRHDRWHCEIVRDTLAVLAEGCPPGGAATTELPEAPAQPVVIETAEPVASVPQVAPAAPPLPPIAPHAAGAAPARLPAFRPLTPRSTPASPARREPAARRAA